jgi:small subunit ribosomal protein S5
MAETQFLDIVVSVRRVTKVTQGGKRFSFSALVVSGDQNGSVGLGLGKSREVSSAIAKATARARKSLVTIPLRGTTVTYDVFGRHGATQVMIRPAAPGTGVIAGGAVRAVVRAAGLKDVLTKTIGPSRSGINTAKATFNCFAKSRSLQQIARLRDRSATQIIKGAHHDAA